MLNQCTCATPLVLNGTSPIRFSVATTAEPRTGDLSRHTRRAFSTLVDFFGSTSHSLFFSTTHSAPPRSRMPPPWRQYVRGRLPTRP